MIPPDALQELTELLPFYVNGTLDAAMRAQIDAALPASPALQAALAQEQDLQGRIRAGTEDLLAQSDARQPARTAQVMARTAVLPEREAAPGGSRVATALAFLNPRRWSPAVALTLALAVPVQAAIIASQSSSITQLEKENFELASGPCAERDRSHGVVLQLKDDARWSDVAALLDAEALVIVESAAFGVLTVRGDKTAQARTELITRLRQSPLIASAEPEA